MKEWKKPEIKKLGFTETNEVWRKKDDKFVCDWCGAQFDNNGNSAASNGLQWHQQNCPNKPITPDQPIIPDRS